MDTLNGTIAMTLTQVAPKLRLAEEKKSTAPLSVVKTHIDSKVP